MDENLIKVHEIFLSKINQVCSRFGLNNIMAQIYALLYFSNNALSLNDMVERLKISKGSVSTNIRALERYGAVKKVWIKGSRRDYYEAELDISKVIIDRIKSMVQNRLSEVGDMLDSSYQALNAFLSSEKKDSESVRIFKERLDKLRRLESKAHGLFKLLNSDLLDNALDNHETTPEEGVYIAKTE